MMGIIKVLGPDVNMSRGLANSIEQRMLEIFSVNGHQGRTPLGSLMGHSEKIYRLCGCLWKVVMVFLCKLLDHDS